MYPNIIATILLLILPFAHHKIISRINNQEETNEFLDYLGKSGVLIYFVSIGLLWIIPLGSILVPVFFVAISFISPYGRMEWEKHTKLRLQVLSTGLVIILLCGLLPAPSPVEPEGWGSPLQVESSSSSLYPAGTESAWFLDSGGNDWSFVVSYKMNTPYQFGSIGQAYSTLKIADIFSLQDEKMSSSLELLDSQFSFPFVDSEYVDLVKQTTQETHTYSYQSPEGEQTIDLNFRIWSVNSLVIGTSAEGVKVAEVLFVTVGSWDGSTNMLAVIRPVSDSLDSDRYAQTYVSEWYSELLKD